MAANGLTSAALSPADIGETDGLFIAITSSFCTFHLVQPICIGTCVVFDRCCWLGRSPPFVLPTRRAGRAAAASGSCHLPVQIPLLAQLASDPSHGLLVFGLVALACDASQS